MDLCVTLWVFTLRHRRGHVTSISRALLGALSGLVDRNREGWNQNHSVEEVPEDEHERTDSLRATLEI